MKLTYRPEIDGLRAIAVSAVILYHAQITILGYQPFKGGFIGVDIFFVISGYLITSIILKELVTTGSFSFKHFYERRIRRILPALLFVMLVSLPFAWMNLVPSSFVDFSKSILYSLGFSSNFYFHYSGEVYGATHGLFLPFLHTWSLSVEEQYYTLFPIVLLITFKYFKKYLIHIFILGFVVSLGLADWGSRNHPSFNFYVLPTRGWELLAGSILAYFEITLGHRSKHKILNQILPSIGLFLIGHSILFFNDETFHPSFYTLSPIIGVSLIIWFSHKDELITKILSTKLFVGIGLISYSLYLWHYPVFAFERIIKFKTELDNVILLILIIFILSVLTFFLIEKPCRYKIKKIILLVSIFFGLNLIVNLIILQNNGFEKRFNFLKKNYPSIEIDGKKLDIIRNKFFLSLEENKKNFSNKDKILIIGDSHGKDLFLSFYLNPNLFTKYDFNFLPSNIKKIEDVFEQIKNYNIIIFSFRWHYQGADKLKNEDISNFVNKIAQLQNRNRKIIITSGTNHYKAIGYVTLLDDVIMRNNNKINIINLKEYYFRNRTFHSDSRENLLLKKEVIKNKIIYLNKEDYLCDLFNKQCDYITDNNKKIFTDYGHYTLDGAKFFGKKIYELDWLKIN